MIKTLVEAHFGLLRNLMSRCNSKLPLIALRRVMFKIRVRGINNFSSSCGVWSRLGLGACEMCCMCHDFLLLLKEGQG